MVRYHRLCGCAVVHAQGESVVPFLDFPERVVTNPAVDRRIIDIRTINGPFTPKDQWYTTQHYGHPKVDVATFTLKVPESVVEMLPASSVATTLIL